MKICLTFILLVGAVNAKTHLRIKKEKLYRPTKTPNQISYDETFGHAVKESLKVVREAHDPENARFSTTALKRLAANLLGFSVVVTATQAVCIGVNDKTHVPMWQYIALLSASGVFATSLIYSLNGIIDKSLPLIEMWFVWQVHIFSLTAAPIIWSIMYPVLKAKQYSAYLLAAGLAFILEAQLFEIVAHSKDHWYYQQISSSQFGPLNLCFNIGLMSGFTFIAAATWTTWWSISIAFLTPFAVYKVYGKGIRYALQTFSASYSCWLLCRGMDSYWPVIYFFSAFPIIYSTLHLVRTENQLFHCIPALVSWFGLVIPLDLAKHDSADAASTLSDVMVGNVVFLGASFLATHLVPSFRHFLKKCNLKNKDDLIE